MNRDRRVVLSLAVAAALAVAAVTLNRLLTNEADGGWFMYTPNSEPSPFSTGSADGESVRSAAIWLTAIAVWLAFSWRLFRTQTD